MERGRVEGQEQGRIEGNRETTMAFYENLKAGVDSGQLTLDAASSIATDTEDFLTWYKSQAN